MPRRVDDFEKMILKRKRANLARTVVDGATTTTTAQ